MNHNEKIVRSLKFVVDKYLDSKVKDPKLKVSVSKIFDIAKKSVVMSHMVDFISNDFLKQCFSLFLVYEGDSIDNAVDKVFNKKILKKITFESAEEIKTEEECDRCSEGSVECWDCDGDGDVSCAECDGEKTITCHQCDGEGEEDGETCDSCDGTGEIACEECDSTGRIECTGCYGEGTWDCTYCEGEGTKEIDSDEFPVEVELSTFIVLSDRFDSFMEKYDDDYDDNHQLKIDFSKEIMKKLEKDSDSIMSLGKSYYDDDIDEWNDQSESIATYIHELEIRHKLVSYSLV
ncbi:hypothetical protein EB155_09460 [archaeon]|nr:hypothetical protein [archaeon]